MIAATPGRLSHLSVARFHAAESSLFASLGLQVSSLYLDLPAPHGRVRVLERGDGPPVMLLPGLGAVAAVWAQLLSNLAGFRLLAVERPGCGLSDRFQLGDLGLRQWSTLLVAGAADALGLERFSIIGNSIGGTTALWYALSNPGRIDRLVLIGAPPFVLDAEAPFSMRVLSIPFISRKALRRNGPADVDAVFTRMGHPRNVLNNEMTELVTAARELPGYVDGFVGVLHNATGLTGRRVSVTAAELATMHRPTLLVWGDSDTHGRVITGRRLVETMPDARLDVVHGGHLPWLDDPVQCAALISDFLSGGS